MSKKTKQYFAVIFGLLLSAISFNLFLEPNNLVPGGVGGLAIIIRQVFSINESIFIFVVNIVLIIISYIVLGKEKTQNTIFGSLIYPLLISLTTNIKQLIIIENLDMLIITILSGVLSGVGLGIVYKNGFTSGGTDILNQIMEQKMKIPMGKSILYVDGIIVLLSAIVFGIPTMIYSIIVLYIISNLSNKTMLELDQNKVFYIHTSKPREIKEFLINNFGYDLTILDTIGGFLKKKEKMYMCSVSKRDYYAVKEGILYIDPQAFIIITNAYEQQNANVLIRNSQKINTRKSKVLKRLDYK